jgi:hypothetical protein
MAPILVKLLRLLQLWECIVFTLTKKCVSVNLLDILLLEDELSLAFDCQELNIWPEHTKLYSHSYIPEYNGLY